MIFPCRHHFQADNKQPYSHAIKLPEGRFRQIRLSGVSQLSGSVPRSENKQSGNICRWAAAHGAGKEHNIWYVIPAKRRQWTQDMACGGRRAPERARKIRNN